MQTIATSNYITISIMILKKNLFIFLIIASLVLKAYAGDRRTISSITTGDSNVSMEYEIYTEVVDGIERLRLICDITNKGSNHIYFSKENTATAHIDGLRILKLPELEMMPLTEQGKTLLGKSENKRGIVSMATLGVEPGKTRRVSADLDEVFDFSNWRKDRKSLQVNHDFRYGMPPNENEILLSNSFQFGGVDSEQINKAELEISEEIQPLKPVKSETKIGKTSPSTELIGSVSHEAEPKSNNFLLYLLGIISLVAVLVFAARKAK